jgi:hypothetical protein
MSTKRLQKLQLVKQAQGSAPDGTQGRVTHDARGNAVWNWDVDTGVLARKSVAELLTSLDAPGGLSLDCEVDRQNGWSGDPYNRAR